MRLVIAVPTYEKWEPDFGHSLALTMADLARSGLEACRLSRCEATNIAEGRIDLARDAIENGATHILYCDSDMVFRPADVRKLIEHDVDVVGVNYMKRNPPHDMTAAWPDGSLIKDGSGLVEAGSIGFGLVLIKTSVFEKVKEPWFDFFFRDDTKGFIGEDVWFCRMAAEQGVKIHCDLDLSVGHVSKRVLRCP